MIRLHCRLCGRVQFEDVENVIGQKFLCSARPHYPTAVVMHHRFPHTMRLLTTLAVLLRDDIDVAWEDI